MVQSNGNRGSDVLTSRGTDIYNPPPNDHTKDALRLALGSILAPKRSTPNPSNARSSSSSGTASPAHLPFPYTPSASTPPAHGSHLPFPHPHPHPHAHQHLHSPLGPSPLAPSREHSHTAPGHSSSTSTTHSPHASSPVTPITETTSSPFGHYPRPGLLSRSISSSSTHGGPGRSTDSAVISANQPQTHSAGEQEGIHAPLPRLSDGSTSTGTVPAVAVTTPGGTPITKNKFIQTLEGKTPSAWEALIHGSFS
ncbi:hypothetical protein BDP27DRAFT_1309348 [Rhodocollybia butyracea]|uniref:Uncharacterized protein n=1 Tax=Rhodocollybia butyracea TaxID=206335 RepID=A0A9P5QBU7_9AGAR|nr:hypothetical protein BDP27DRAFT_1309348 [Rhodocollybia butyracea]